jgi:hypothetical protein
MVEASKDLRTATTRPWKKWWFWTIIGAAVSGGATGAYFGLRSSPNGPTGPQANTSLSGVPGAP